MSKKPILIMNTGDSCHTFLLSTKVKDFAPHATQPMLKPQIEVTTLSLRPTTVTFSTMTDRGDPVTILLDRQSALEAAHLIIEDEKVRLEEQEQKVETNRRRDAALSRIEPLLNEAEQHPTHRSALRDGQPIPEVRITINVNPTLDGKELYAISFRWYDSEFALQNKMPDPARNRNWYNLTEERAFSIAEQLASGQVPPVLPEEEDWAADTYDE